VVGDGPYAAMMKELLPEGIYTGSLHREELAAAYASADFFVFPSTTDTFGNVVIEAQASGLPVIVSDVGGPRDLIEEGVDGLITKGLDLDALTAAIGKLAAESGTPHPDGNGCKGPRRRTRLEPSSTSLLGRSAE